MYCKYCGKLLDEQAKFCTACGKCVNENTSTRKKGISKILSIILILFSFYGFFADALTITEDGKLNPRSFVILFLLVGCAIFIYRTYINLINIICFGTLSIIYLVRIITLQEVLMEEFGPYIDFDSFKILYWTYFITLVVITAVLDVKYIREHKNENLFQKISSFRNCLKDAQTITSDEINSIALSCMSRRSIYIIGQVSCIILILQELESINFHESNILFNLSTILLLISNACFGIFLYAMQSNIEWKRPIMRLNQCFNIALCAFIFELCADISFAIPWISVNKNYVSILSIKIVIDIVLCFNVYRISCGFRKKQNTSQYVVSIMISVVCLCAMLVFYILEGYLMFVLFNHLNFDNYSYCEYRDIILQQSLQNHVTTIAPIALNIVLVLLFSNMARSLISLTTNRQLNEEKVNANSTIL